MSATILETLTSADRYLQGKEILFRHRLGKKQLHNAVFLLKKGHGLEELVEPLLDRYSYREGEDA